MGIFDVFSKRQKRERGEMPDTWRHDVLPPPFRVQVVHIWTDTFGTDDMIYEPIVRVLQREYGFFRLPSTARGRSRSECDELINFFLEAELDQALDAIERFYAEYELELSDTVSELNQRFREHGVGYQLEQGRIVPMSSDLLHQEAVRPALQLLRAAPFQPANDEFLTAHEHYRHGRHEEALVSACKAFESTLKIILKARRIPFDPDKVTAKTLVNLAQTHKLVPAYVAEQQLMGVATLRNKLAGHGQGEAVRHVDEAYVRYALHLSAAAIVFLVDLSKQSPSR